MTLEETSAVMDLLNAAYPQYYSKQTDRQRVVAAELWAAMFADDALVVVLAAVKVHIAADEKGFPPHIGAIKARIRQITTAPEMTELEAWNYVKGAVMGVDWTAPEKKFELLPAEIQQVLGSPQTLVDWGKLPETEFHTVIQSNFMRSYRGKIARNREYNALPVDIKKFISTGVPPVAAIDAPVKERGKVLRFDS